jgi:hypothetical protein
MIGTERPSTIPEPCVSPFFRVGFGGFQYGIEAAEDGHRQDHIAVFAPDEDIAQAVVRDVPDEAGDPVELGLVHEERFLF